MKEQVDNGTDTKQLRNTSQRLEATGQADTDPCQDCTGGCGVCEARTSRIEEEEKVKGDTLTKIEQRINPAEFEVREESDGMHFSGYAALFNSPSEPLPFVESIASGAFKRSLKSRNDIKFLWNHDSGEILGSTRARTVNLIEDDRGL